MEDKKDNKNSVSEEDIIEAERLKNEANKCFNAQQYDKAGDLYSQAIEMNPFNPVYYSNRSFSSLKCEHFGFALTDATKAIQLDSKYLKAYYRRAAAYTSLGKYKEALQDLKIVKTAKPNDKDANQRYTECYKIVQRQMFEKAISVDTPKRNLVDSLKLEDMCIEDNYEGPKLKDDTTVTEEFVKELITTYKSQKLLHRKYAYKILVDVKEYFMKQMTLVDIKIADDDKFTICGDIHGQFYDLCNIFDLNGMPSPSNPYLFNGDFVDRGSFSVECIFVLFSFKLLYPNHFFLARGNHESVSMNRVYGFEGEVKAKYSATMFDLFTEVYNWLPLAHCVNSKVLVMHGGLFSDDKVTLDDIKKIDRNMQPSEEGFMCELLWSDPQPMPGRSPSKRGVGIQFGPDVTRSFLEYNDLLYIVRSHEVKQEGYEIAHEGKCITVFSAPNYCDVIGNSGAYMTFTGSTIQTPKFSVFQVVPHPNVKPMAYANPMLNFLC